MGEINRHAAEYNEVLSVAKAKGFFSEYTDLQYSEKLNEELTKRHDSGGLSVEESEFLDAYNNWKRTLEEKWLLLQELRNMIRYSRHKVYAASRLYRTSDPSYLSQLRLNWLLESYNELRNILTEAGPFLRANSVHV